jgi:hypothetical protein
LYLLVIVGFIGFVREMVTAIENNAIENNNVNVIANAFKEKAVMPWYKGTKSLAEGKGKSAFKKAALKRLGTFEAFAGEEGDPTAFAESGPLCEITRSAWSIAEAAAKADPTGTTPMGSLGIGLGIRDRSSIEIFKESLIQATTWASRQVANEMAQAAAKAEAKKAAEDDVKEIFSTFFEEGVDALDDPQASDAEILSAAKIICTRIQKFLFKELSEIQKNGSGTVARAEAILERVRDFDQALRQGLSDKALNAVDSDGIKIWISNAPFPATTARRILESCQIKVSALQSRADRTLSRLRAAQGVGSIEW